MKVQIVQTVEVSDDQREALARLLDGPDARKRHAKRDEFKEYVWAMGAGWAAALAAGLTESDVDDAARAAAGDPDSLEDLVGDTGPQAPANADEDFADLLGDVQDEPGLDDLL